LQLGKEEKLMRKLMVGKILIPAFLLAVLVAGCGDSDVGGGPTSPNKALTERRVERTKNFLVEHGVPATHFETRSYGKEDQLSTDQIRELIAQDTSLSPADRQQMLNNLKVMVLANNRRVDVTLSTTGQQSTRLYPFNAKDFLALISPKGGEKKPPVKKKP